MMDKDLLLLGLAVGALVAGLLVINSFERKKKAETDRLWKRIQREKRERKAQVWRE